MTTVLVYEITDGYGIYGGVDFESGLYIHVKTSTPTGGTTTVELRDINDNLVSAVTSGPNLLTDDGDAVQVSIRYGWCDEGDYIYYNSTGAFPYASRTIQFDSDQCTLGGGNDGALCDTIIQSIKTVNDINGGDGQIIVKASSKNIPPGYFLTYGYIVYNADGIATIFDDNTSGTFNNVLAGDYIIVVSWNGGSCQQFAKVTVKAGEPYQRRFRLEYDDIRNGTTRIDIFKRDYIGSIEEVCGAGTPFVINYEGDENDAYRPIVPSGCELSLISMYPEQFFELFEDSDDQKYFIQAYHKIPAQPFIPAEMDPLSEWYTTISPSIGPIGSFANDSFGNSFQEWKFYAFPKATINSISPSKYLVTSFIASAGQPYNVSLTYQLYSGGPFIFRNYKYSFTIVMFDAINSIVGTSTISADRSISGSSDFTDTFTITPSADVVKIGIQVKSLLIDFTPFDVKNLVINNVRINWTTLTPPTITLTGNQASNKIFTDYDFEPGKEYSFEYDFSNGGTWVIEFTDIYGNDFGVNKTVLGTEAGNYTFIAPSGITRITISVSQSSGTRTSIVNSFLNVTEPQDVTGSTFEVFGKWFILTQFYSEAYAHEPNQVTILASDGLGDLKNTNFVDAFGNEYKGKRSYMQIISDLLKHTPLDIPIRSTINLYDVNMLQGVTDDPLSQLYFDTSVYKGKDAEFVLGNVLTVLGAKIFQALGCWWVVRLEYSVSSNLLYRQFNFDGEYESYGSIDTVIPLTGPVISERMNFRDKSQVLSLNSNYGSISLDHDLSKDGNLVDGTFEIEQADPSTSSGFLEWDFLQGQAAMSWGYEAVDNSDSTGAFFAQFNNGVDPQKFSRLYTKKIPLKIESGDIIKVKFDFMVIPEFNDIPYQVLGWQFRIIDNITGTTYDFKPTDNGGIISVLNTDVINEMYVDKFNDFDTIELGPFGFSGPSFPDASFQLSFYFHNHFGRDYDYQGIELRFAPTSSVPLGSQEYYVMDFSNTLLGVITRAYRLAATTEVADGINTIRPNDYHEFNNPRQWQKIGDYAVGRSTSLTRKVLFDNVVVAYYPKKIDPPGHVFYSKTVNPVNKNKLEGEFFVGDLPDYYNAARIYNGWLRLEDDTPTSSWHRREVIEQKLLLKILLDEYIIQRTRTRKLTGRVITNNYISYLNSFQDFIDNNRYTNTRFSIDDKQCSYELCGVRVDVGDNGEPPVDLSGFTMAFSLAFDS